MIKTFNDFLLLARAKHGNKFSYVESTFRRYSADEMTIIHNETEFEFKMIPAAHINSNSGIPQDLMYNVTYPFEEFIKDVREKLGDDFCRYSFDEETYRGKSIAIVIYKDRIKYYISPYNIFYFKDFKNHLVTEETLENYKKLINKYSTFKDFKTENKKLCKKLKDSGFKWLWQHLEVNQKRVCYSEDYLRDLLTQYKNAGKSRSQFVMDHGSEHAYMRRNNLIRLYYECELTVASDLQQGIYACEFNLPDGNYAYVGLTFNFKERESDHRHGDSDSAVHKFIKSRNLNPDDMIFRIIIQPEDCNDPSKAETEVYEQYKKDGWIMLNTAPTGSRGHMPPVYYTKDDILKMIKENNLKSVHQLYDFNRRAWTIAKDEGYLEEILTKKTHRFVGIVDVEYVIKSIKQYSSYTEWRKNEEALYAYVLRSHMLTSVKNKLNESNEQ